MSRPIQEKVISGATATGAGDDIETGGRISVSIFAVTDADPSTLDVVLEVSMDGTNYTPLRENGSDRGVLAAADFVDPDGNGSYAAYDSVHGVAARHVRARITGYGTAGNVDVWVAASSNPQSAKDYRDVTG